MDKDIPGRGIALTDEQEGRTNGFSSYYRYIDFAMIGLRR